MPRLESDRSSYIYLGVDPGASGGIAALDSHGRIMLIRPMPDSEAEILDILMSCQVFQSDKLIAVIEQVSGWIGGNQGVDKEGNSYAHQGQTGSAMFKFGQSYGALRMGLIAIGLIEDITFYAVIPRTWQKGLEVQPREKNESRPQFKRRLKDTAQALFLQEKRVTLSTCDALLMAEYCRRKYNKETKESCNA